MTDYDKAGEKLRLALPIMAKKQVAVTPVNYAIFYEYVSQTNELLNTELDKLIPDNQPITDETCQALYDKKLLAFEVEKLKKTQQGLRNIVDAILKALMEAGNETSHYDNVLGKISNDLTSDVAPEKLLSIVNTLTQETKQVKNTHLRFKADIENNQQEVAMLREELEKVRQEATTDGLTGLLNRRTLDNQLPKEIIHSKQANTALSILLIDIDKFKLVNDNYGHLVGDKVIRYIAKTIKTNVSDETEVFRFGGEEFCVLLPNTSMTEAMNIAENIRKAQEKGELIASSSNERIGRVTVSTGVATYLKNESIESFIDRADKALYQAKSKGRNRVVGATDNPKTP